jgi:hypothetical protein
LQVGLYFVDRLLTVVYWLLMLDETLSDKNLQVGTMSLFHVFQEFVQTALDFSLAYWVFRYFTWPVIFRESLEGNII